MTRPFRASAGAWGLAFAIIVLLAAPPSSGADPGDEALLLAQTAASRAQRRLGPLVRSADLDAVARRHAQRLAAAPGPPFHNPSLSAETAGWQAVGEVVGRINIGPGWEATLEQLFLGSPVHRQVILSPAFNAVGVGTARSATGVISAVEVFARGTAVPRPSAPRVSRQHPAAVPRPRVTSPPMPPATSAPPPPPPTIVIAPLPPPPTIAPDALPTFEVAAGTGPRSPGWPGLDLVASAALFAACAGLRRVMRRSAPKR